MALTQVHVLIATVLNCRLQESRDLSFPADPSVLTRGRDLLFLVGQLTNTVSCDRPLAHLLTSVLTPA